MLLDTIKKNLVVIIFFFILGTLAGFLSTQWSYFSFEDKFNLIDVLNLVVTALAGYYIASTLSKQLTARRVEKDLIIEEIHKIRSLYNILNDTVIENQVLFAKTVSTTKRISVSFTALESLASTCNYNIKDQINNAFMLNSNIKAAITNDPNTNNSNFYSLESRSIVSFNNNYQLIQQKLLELIIFINRQ